MAASGSLTVTASSLRHDQWLSLPVEVISDEHGHDAAEFVQRRGRTPERAARLAAMRERVGNTLADQANAKPLGLAGLRLRAGLSQQQLAERLGTQQPSVARWERDPSTMLVLTMRRMAEVLGVDVAQMALAVCAQTPHKEASDA